MRGHSGTTAACDNLTESGLSEAPGATRETPARSLPRHGRGLLPPSAVLCSVIKVCSKEPECRPWQGWAPNPRPGPEAACSKMRVVVVEADDAPDARDVSGARLPAAAGGSAHRNKALLLALGAARCCSSTCSNTPTLLLQLLAAAIRAGDVGRVSELLLSLAPPPSLAFGLLQASSFGNRDM